MIEKRLNLNADMGESYGRFVLGNDEALAPFVSTISVACGYHAADPATMRRSVRLARDHNLEIGAHISYPDFAGFGRRRMELSETEVFDITVHQIGALLGFCRAEGVPMTHVKPHGQLGLTGMWHRPTARGIVCGMKAVDPELLLLMAGDAFGAECSEANVKMIWEGYVDLDYAPDGSLVLERVKQSRSPEDIASLAVSLTERQGREATDGSWLPIPTQSICIHGDGPNATDIARAVGDKLRLAGYRMVGIKELAQS